jgi:hypothetical protein
MSSADPKKQLATTKEVEQRQLSEAAATVERTTAVTIMEVMDAIYLSPTTIITDCPMAITFVQITQESHTTGARMDTMRRIPRATTWAVTSGTTTPFDVEGRRRMKIN